MISTDDVSPGDHLELLEQDGAAGSTPDPDLAATGHDADQHSPAAAADPAPRLPVELSAVAIELALAAARSVAGDEAGGVESVGDYLGAHAEDEIAVTAGFRAQIRGYHGWQWSVTLASLSEGDWTVSEVVLLPGDDALVAPAWVPWDRRVRGGDLGVGDLLPTPADDPRLVPGYLLSDDPEVEDVVFEYGLGRKRVLGREGRIDAAERWYEGAFGPSDPMALQAPGRCGQCGFFVPLSGSLGGMFGACANDMAPGDARVVAVEYGCGAHSEAVAAILEPSGRGDLDGLRVDEERIDVHVHEQSDPTVSSAPDAVAPDAVTPDAVTSDSAGPDVAGPDAARPDAVAPDEIEELAELAVSDEAVPVDVEPTEAASPEDVTPEDVTLEDLTPETATPEGVPSEDVTPGMAATPGDADPDDATAGSAVPVAPEAISVLIASDGTVSSVAAPDPAEDAALQAVLELLPPISGSAATGDERPTDSGTGVVSD